uniref:Uncharacterized protein n=1 Tax=Glossina austeni TaxID=7395 RepID=A0A1A9VAV2_GLOAU
MYSKDCSSRLNFQEKQSYASKCSYKESSVTITLTFVLEKNRKWMKGGFISNSASTMFTTLFGWKAKKISITATLDFFAAIFNAKKVANELCILLSVQNSFNMKRMLFPKQVLSALFKYKFNRNGAFY